jgi:ABC-type transporter Mla MlaB component
MLKITEQNHDRPTTLFLEGRLAGPWVDEAEREWNDILRRVGPGSVVVNLRGIVFVDAAGKKLLGRMLREGAELSEARLLTKLVVEELRSGPQAS